MKQSFYHEVILLWDFNRTHLVDLVGSNPSLEWELILAESHLADTLLHEAFLDLKSRTHLGYCLPVVEVAISVNEVDEPRVLSVCPSGFSFPVEHGVADLYNYGWF